MMRRCVPQRKDQRDEASSFRRKPQPSDFLDPSRWVPDRGYAASGMTTLLLQQATTRS